MKFKFNKKSIADGMLVGFSLPFYLMSALCGIIVRAIIKGFADGKNI